MIHAQEIIQEFARRECERICTGSIRRLQKLKRESMLSGDDSCLANVWDEICVQVQDEESFSWEAYVEIIDRVIERQLLRVAPSVRMAIGLETEEGSTWDAMEGDEPETVLEDIIRHIRGEYLFQKAEMWTNRRISGYLKL